MPTSATTSITDTAARLRLAVTRTARRLRQEALREETGAVMSPTATAALATIESRGPLTPSELAEIEQVRRPTATRVLGCLEEAGLTNRTPDPNDGRSSLVSISTAGRERLRGIRRRKNAYLARRMRALDAAEVATLERAAEILERMLEEGRSPAEGERG